MWHWTTRTGEYPEAVAFTQQPSEPEPVVTERAVVVTEAEPVEDDNSDAGTEPVTAQGFELAG